MVRSRSRSGPRIFVVEPRVRAGLGVTRFPIDMLRYDSCRPLSESDASAIERTFTPHSDGGPIRLIALGVRPRLTPARWLSYGWRVLDQEGAA